MLRTIADTSNVRDSRCGPPLVDEDRHAVCRAISKGVAGVEELEGEVGMGRSSNCTNKEKHNAASPKKPGEREKSEGERSGLKLL